MPETDAQEVRTEAILGDAEDLEFDKAVAVFFKHLKANLQLPCEVTGIEDFRWEEPYVLGGWDQDEYEQLKKTRPSYENRYDLLEIRAEGWSEWMMFHGEDIAAHVRRISDGREFILGLSELEATDKKSSNHQHIDDYGTWFVNSR